MGNVYCDKTNQQLQTPYTSMSQT